jgi:OPT oligopeptide transporter protein
MPISSSTTFDNTGSVYNISAVVTNGEFDVQKYRQYSPVLMSATFVITYFGSFATFTSALTHTYRMCLVFTATERIIHPF